MNIIKEHTVIGRVAHTHTQQPLENVEVKIKTQIDGGKSTFNTKTDNQGNYKLKFLIEVDEDTQVAQEQPNIEYSLDSFSSSSTKPYLNDNTLKDNLRVIQLSPEVSELQQEILKFQNIGEEQIELLKNISPNVEGEALMNVINLQISNIVNRIIPSVINTISHFGVTKIGEAIDNKSKGLKITPNRCPDKDELADLIKKRNNLVKTLNNIYKTINSVIIALGIFNGLVEIFKLVKSIFLKLPIPSTFGTLPGPSGGVIFSYPLGKILTLEDNVKKFEKIIEKYQKLSLVVLSSLVLLRFILKQVIDLLEITDELIEECSEGEFTQEEIDKELLESVKDSEEDNNPIILHVNGFNMGIEVENKKVGTLNRRFAVAKNQNGHVLLRGESSFSSSDQILIDELIYYIEVNNLKAF